MWGIFNGLYAFSRIFFDFILYQRRYQFFYRLAIGPKIFGYFDTGLANDEILLPVLFYDGAALCS